MRQIQYFPTADILDSSFMEVSLRSDFQKEMSTLRKIWGINTDEMSDKEWLEFIQNTKLLEALSLVLNKLRIHAKWKEQALSFLLTDSHRGGRMENKKGVRLEIPLEGSGYPTITVGPESIFEDVKQAWDNIPAKFKFSGRRGNKRIADIEAAIYLLVEEGKVIVDISEELKRRYGKRGDLDFGNIKKIYSDFCTRLKIPKGQRKKLKTK